MMEGGLQRRGIFDGGINEGRGSVAYENSRGD
jgi:hypothetical protein